VNGSASDDQVQAVARMIAALTPKVDAETVRTMVAEQYGTYSAEVMAKVDARIAEVTAPVELTVTQPSGESVKISGAHKILPTLVTIVGNARKHVLMVGPAGTGKSKLASQVAEALSLAFREISLSPAMSPTALLGYMTADGTYVSTAFRQVYEHGGVFHFDEMDNSHPSILAVINAALANGHCEFPDARITKHQDAYIVASANTYGRGPDRVYVGRQALDGSTLDRFVVVPVDYDAGLESDLCNATGLDGNKVAHVLRYVRQIRANAESGKMALIFSIRGSVNLCSLLQAGIAPDDAIEYTIRKGISDGDWSKVTSGVPSPNL
jgi:cobaltochelatase CobS